MRTVRNVAFALLVTCVLVAYQAPTEASFCGPQDDYWGYLAENCYPEYAGMFEGDAQNFCWDVCYDHGGVCDIVVFNMSNPCEAFCYCRIPPY